MQTYDYFFTNQNNQERKWCYKQKCSTIFLILLFTISFNSATAQLPYRIEGSIETGYQSWTASNLNIGYRNSDGTEWLQQHKIGVRGYYLSPNILSYYVGTNFKQSDKKNRNLNIRNRSYDIIDANGRILQNRNIWANTYLKRTWNEYTYGRFVNYSYDNLVGTNLFILLRQLPNIKLSYQFSNSEASQYRDLSTHVSSIQLTKNSRTSSVRAEFRDEQTQGRYAGGITRNQNFQLNGRWDVFDRRGVLNADVDYTGYNFFQMTRFNLRYLQNFRQRDRLLVMYGFNVYESQYSNTSSNLFELDYRRILTPLWMYVTHTTLFRQDVDALYLRGKPDYHYFSNGFEYTKTIAQNQDFKRYSGYGYVDIRDNRAIRERFSIRLNGMYEQRNTFPQWIWMMNRYSVTTRFDERDHQKTDTYVNLDYVNQVNYTPIDKLMFQNYFIAGDQEGAYVKTNLENRSEVQYRPSRALSLQSGLTYRYMFRPELDQSLYWTNTVQAMLWRNVQFSAQSFHNFLKQMDLYSDRVLLKGEYRLRETYLMGQWETRKELGRRFSILLFTATRTFGI